MATTVKVRVHKIFDHLSDAKAKCQREGGKVTKNGTFCVLEKGRTFVETEDFCAFLGAKMPIIKSHQDQAVYNFAREVKCLLKMLFISSKTK